MRERIGSRSCVESGVGLARVQEIVSDPLGGPRITEAMITWRAVRGARKSVITALDSDTLGPGAINVIGGPGFSVPAVTSFKCFATLSWSRAACSYAAPDSRSAGI